MSGIEKLLVTVAKLRDPETGCPWDIEQTHQSITDCLIDECCELLQTIDRLDMEHMEEELGDLLLQVIFHAQIAKENGHFDFDSVCEVLNDKLVRRHPHVFGDEKDYELLVDWDCDFYAPTPMGEENSEANIIFKFRKNWFTQEQQDEAYKGLREAAGSTENRGLLCSFSSVALVSDSVSRGSSLASFPKCLNCSRVILPLW